MQALESPWILNYQKDNLSDNLLDPGVIKNLTVFTVSLLL